MSGTPQRRHCLVPIAIAVCLLLPPMTDGAEAGHRSHFSIAIGFPYAFHFGYPYFHLAYTPYAPSHHHAVAVPVRNDIGAIRLRVKPKKTEVFLDGDYLGRAGRYDGYPGYLWLEPGEHTLVFYRPGYRTFSRSFRVRSGMVTDVRLEMEPGETSPPEAFFASRSAAAVDAPPRAPVRPHEEAPASDLRADAARIRLIIEPAEASIYLDGRFLGTGNDLARLRGGLMLDAGEHLVEVLHPDFAPDRVSFRVKPGEEVELRVALEAPPRT